MKTDSELAARHLIASYRTYAEAERAVDSLADDGFPVNGLTILARDLRLAEDVTGRRGYGEAAFESATAGALVGGVFGFLFGSLSWIDPLISGLALALYGLALGALIGAAFGAVTHALSGGRRNFSSVGSISAERYELTTDDPEQARRAARTLESRQLAGA